MDARYYVTLQKFLRSGDEAVVYTHGGKFVAVVQFTGEYYFSEKDLGWTKGKRRFLFPYRINLKIIHESRNPPQISFSGEKSIDLSPKDMTRFMLEAKAAGLLHDIGHSPFGHCLDRYIGLKKEIPFYGHYDKHFSGAYIKNHFQDLLKNLGINPDNIRGILGPDKTTVSGYSELVADIIDSPLDVDRMDYLIRDAHLTGLPLGFVNMKALIESIRPFVSDSHFSVTYTLEALYHIEHFLYARDAMYVNCYESALKTAAEGMIVTAFDDFYNTFKVSLDDLILLSDDQLLTMLIQYVSPSMPCFKLAQKIVKGDIFSQVYELAC